MKKPRTQSQKDSRRQSDKFKAELWKLYRNAHPDEIATCKICKNSKPLRLFAASYSVRTTCLLCISQSQKRWRENHPVNQRKIGAKLAAIAREHIKTVKSVPCTICGKSWPPHVMDFHHIDLHDKRAAIPKMTGSSVNRLNVEMVKCSLVCANCHRNITFNNKHQIPTSKNRITRTEIVDTPTAPGECTRICASCGQSKGERNFTKLKSGYIHSYCKKCLRERNRSYSEHRTKPRSGKVFLMEYKDNKQCKDCGNIFRYWILDLDHVRENKTANIGKLQLMSLDKIKSEIAKCDLVYVNCHRIRIYAKRQSQTDTTLTEVRFDRLRLVTLNCVDIAKEMLNKYHYAGYGRAASNVFAIMHSDEVAAIIKFAPPVRKEVATKEGMKHDEVLELDRFCISPKFQIKNMASKVMSMAISKIRLERPDIHALVSFADTAQGHTGVIYKASNWKKIGMSASSYEYMRSDGERMNKKTVYDTARRRGMNEKEYAASLGLTKVILPSKHKFIYELN